MTPIIPWYITLIVVSTNLAVAVAIWIIFSRAAARAGLPAESTRRLSTGVAVLLAAWLGTGFFLAPRLGQVVNQDASAVPPVLLLGGAAVGVVLIWFGLSADLRRTAAAAPLPVVIGVQVYRVIGAVFVVLLGLGQLPAHFALPAGWGDVFVGLTAPLVALALLRGAAGSRLLGVGWNLFGLLDLLVAVGMGSGLLVPLLTPGQGSAVPATAMQQFPLVLVPVFAVPVSVLLHVLALSGLRRPVRLGSEAPAPAR